MVQLGEDSSEADEPSDDEDGTSNEDMDIDETLQCVYNLNNYFAMVSYFTQLEVGDYGILNKTFITHVRISHVTL